MNYLTSLANILQHPLNKKNKLSALMRIINWKANKLVFKKPKIVELFAGVKCICYPESSFGSLIIYTKIPDFEEVKLLKRVLKSGDTFIDVGANIGLYTLIAAKKVANNGKVYAFEPVDKPAANLLENIKLNSFTNTRLIKDVVSDKSGKEKFIFETVSEESAINYKGKLTPSIKLDDFIIKEKIKKVRVLKVDVEGAEVKVFRGAKKLLSENNVDYIFFEINKKAQKLGFSTQEAANFLVKYGYTLYKFSSTGLQKLINIQNDAKTFNALAVRKGLINH